MTKQLIIILGLCSQILWAGVVELETLRGKYKAGSQKIEQAYQVGEDNLKTYYSDQLVQLENAALEAGKLDDVLVVRKEIKYFGKNKDYKSKLAQVQLIDLKSAMIQKKDVIDELKKTRYENLKTTYVKYLEVLVSELTKKSRIKEALIVRREQTKYEAKSIASLESSELIAQATLNPDSRLKTQANETSGRPRELIPGEEAPGEFKTPPVSDLLKYTWLRLRPQNISSQDLFRMKDKRVEIYMPQKEEWKTITRFQYSEGILRVKDIDYRWDSQKGYFSGTINAEEFILVQESKAAQVKKLLIDDSMLATKIPNKKRMGKKEAKVAKQEAREDIKSKSIKDNGKKLKKKNS